MFVSPTKFFFWILLALISHCPSSITTAAKDGNSILDHDSSLQSVINSAKLVSHITTEAASRACVLPTSRQLTLIMLYYEECHALRFHVLYWMSLPPQILARVSFLLIDDHSRNSAFRCLRHLRPHIPSAMELNIARADRRKTWNIGGGRNLGSYIACSPYLLICDIDAFVSEPIITAVLTNTSTFLSSSSVPTLYNTQSLAHHPVSKEAFLLNRRTAEDRFKPHPGMILISRQLYWQAKGCDEDFVGHYGHTDVHLRYRLQAYHNVSLNILDWPLLCRLSVKEEEQQVSANSSLAVMSRDSAHNEHLFYEKLNGTVPWNDTVIRFPWHIETRAPSSHSFSFKLSIQKNSHLKALATLYWHNASYVEAARKAGFESKDFVTFFEPLCDPSQYMVRDQVMSFGVVEEIPPIIDLPAENGTLRRR